MASAEPLLAGPLFSSGPPPAWWALVLDGDVGHLQALPPEVLQKPGMRGLSAMHLAAAHNELAVMAFFEDLGVEALAVDARDDERRTPLMHAIATRSTESLIWLLRHGADAALVDSKGWRVVHWAAHNGSVTTMAVLSNLGLDLEVPAAGDGLTPLCIAIEKGHLELVEYLVLTRGCSDTGRTAALRTVKERAPKSVAFWMERCLRWQVGCHEPTPADRPPCSPTAGGCGVPCGLICFKGPELVHVLPRQMCLTAGLFAIAVAAECYRVADDEVDCILCLTSLVCTTLGCLCYFATMVSSPGVVNAECADRRARYRAALEKIAAVGTNSKEAHGSWCSEVGPLIHQFQIVGPPRSKYCAATRRCVPLFDHYCAFLRCTVGRDNYGYFFGTIVISTISCGCLAALAFRALTEANDLLRRLPQESVLFSDGLAVVVVLIYGGFAALWVILLFFHTGLACNGLTTYETLQINDGRRPSHLTDPLTGEYRNPYNRGCLLNLYYRLKGIDSPPNQPPLSKMEQV
eukprot:TRINITY_DN44566_c0_g3_i1.p1 TRINITY_DN44566_c0_g3~~TRINITY_DN44566_c0_g3_i1.p1  ORF type:complete len:519 (+),score=69.96 TRINITY_DN44566_c0_g3_i1:60-1616(+)